MKKLLAAISAMTIALAGAAMAAGAAPAEEEPSKYYVIDGMVYTVDQTVADKAALGIPDSATKPADGDNVDFGKDTPVSCGDAKYLQFSFTVKDTAQIYMDGVFTYTPAEGAQMDDSARKIMFDREIGDLKAGTHSGLLPLTGTLYDTPLEAFEKLHLVIFGGSVEFDTFSLVTLKQVPDQYVIDDKVYTVETVADKAALGIPDSATKPADGDNVDFGKDTPVSCGDAQYLQFSFTVKDTAQIYMDGVFTYTPAEGAQMDDSARKIMFDREIGDLKAGTHSGLLPLTGTLYKTPLEAFEKLHLVIFGGSVEFDTFSLVALKQVSDELVIDGMVYTVDRVVADKAALGIPDSATKPADGDNVDFGKDTPVSCGDAQYLQFSFTVKDTAQIYMDGVFTYTPAEGAQMDDSARKIMFDREIGDLKAGTHSGLLPLTGTLYKTPLEAFEKLHLVIFGGSVEFDTFSLVTLKEKVTETTPDPGPEPEPEGKKVQFNLLPQASGWSGESTLVPEAAENGWILKAAEGTEGGNAIGYFGTTYKEGWLLAYDFTIASGNATINMSFVRGLQDSEYPGGAPDYCLSKAIAAQHGIATVGTEKTSLPAGTYKGVLDLSEVFEGFDGFDKFQHIGVYMGGTTMTFRELAFVTGVEAGVDKPDDGKDDGGDKPATGSALPVAAAGLTVLAAGALLLSRKKG